MLRDSSHCLDLSICTFVRLIQTNEESCNRGSVNHKFLEDGLNDKLLFLGKKMTVARSSCTPETNLHMV